MKIKLKSICPSRYIWHLSFKGNRHSIASKGLDTSYSRRGALFANNQSHWLYNMWPIPIGRYENCFSLHNYDFWRIDTVKAGVKWFIDPIMELDYKTYDCHSKYDYVCTRENISIDALKLYFYNEYDLRGIPFYYKKREIVKRRNTSRSLDLYEDLEFNNWLEDRKWILKMA